MELSGLLPFLRALPGYAEARALLHSGGSHLPSLGLPRAVRAPVAAALAEDIHRPLLVITARPDRTLTLVEELCMWSPALRVLQFNEPNPLFYEPAVWGARTVRARIAGLAALTIPSTPPPVLIASARALMTRTLPRDEFIAHTHMVQTGQSVRLEKLLEGWMDIGYDAQSIVVEPGQFSRRGGIVDIYPMADEWPVRIELFGDEVETIRRFDPATQRSGERIEQVTVTPAREGLPKFKPPDHESLSLEALIPLMYPPASLLDYLPGEARVMVEDWGDLADTVAELEEHAVEQRNLQLEAGTIADEFPIPYLTWAELQDELSDRPTLSLGPRPENAGAAAFDFAAHLHAGPRFGGQVKPLLEHLDQATIAGEAVVVVSRQAQRLSELWNAGHIHATLTEAVTDTPAPGSLTFLNGALSEGWRLEVKDEGGRMKDKASAFILHPSSLQLLTDAEIFGLARVRAPRRERRAVTAPEANYAHFVAGDYIVHEDFGIGRFRELGKRTVDGLEREYLVLEFAEGDELYVPVYQADRLTKYVGADDRPPTLSRLGSPEWHTTKGKAKQAVEEMARELLDLYARRATVGKRAFNPDSPWQAELEGSFPFVETPDQQRAIEEVKADMQRARPMDRLICGDVGFGKTEVALRAAFKAVTDGVQVAILVPTTVLAQQHYHTFQNRLSPYPIKVEMLSRFRTPQQSRAILQQLADGQVDIIVGTHRLLQKDVQFKNLGLVIVDEEQRFGVTHKEKLKRLRTEVDVLTLTATPIPRTLYFALTGIRDISTINTPPEERLPVLTHTGPYNEKLSRQAILRELDRGGQVFFVHNRVQTIGVVLERLERLVPEARIGVGHGQMDEAQLSKVMDDFSEGGLDILLCTSIIESGLDIPNANTLIVDRADTFGLAQLYQLRGRVGRSAAQAYAYFFTDKTHRPTPEARERLETLAEQTDLGAGYSIAMRDLEMRGAGDIIGPKQSGQVTAVGFHLYTRLLSQAVRKLKGSEQFSNFQSSTAEDLRIGELGASANIELPLAISIPSDYVEDRKVRLGLYQRMANVTDEGELDTLRLELNDRFGSVPRPVDNLLYQLRVKLRAVRAGVLAVGSENGQITLTLPPMDQLDQAYYEVALIAGARTSKNRLWLPRLPETEWREALLNVLAKLAEGKEPVAA
jgi:transcription-repair coupling factor (superfamily II helicase)